MEVEDEEMKHEEQSHHQMYIPHLWRSIPEHLWPIWRDICRPKMSAMHAAFTRGDTELLQETIEELLKIPGNTLRRFRGTRNLQKAHTNLERQLREMSLTGVVYQQEGNGVGQMREVKDHKDEPNVQKIKKATTLVHEGHVRRAVRSLLSEGVPSITERTIENLKSLHPQGPSRLPRCPEDAPTMLRVDKEKLREIIKRELANGSAPGRSGWTGDLLKALVDDETCMEGVASMTMAIINGQLQGKVRTLLLSSVLIGLEKPNGGTRPIAMGEIFYKAAASYMLKLVAEPAREALGPSQFAFAPGGSEAAVTCLRLALMEHPSWCILACDMKTRLTREADTTS